MRQIKNVLLWLRKFGPPKTNGRPNGNAPIGASDRAQELDNNPQDIAPQNKDIEAQPDPVRKLKKRLARKTSDFDKTNKVYIRPNQTGAQWWGGPKTIFNAMTDTGGDRVFVYSVLTHLAKYEEGRVKSAKRTDSLEVPTSEKIWFFSATLSRNTELVSTIGDLSYVRGRVVGGYMLLTGIGEVGRA